MKKSTVFFSAFAVSLLTLSLGAGLFAVGYNSRRTIEGTTPPGTYEKQDGRWVFTDSRGNRVTLTLLDEQETKTALIPAPARAVTHLFAGMSKGLRLLADAIEN
jgi:hypothetical protein